jgi:mannose-6-phosphate isomerase class I
MNVIQFGEQSGGLCEPVRITHGGSKETVFAACRHFATERWEFSERIAAVTSPENFELLIFLEGKGRIEFAGGAEPYAPAQVWLVPAALGAYQLEPESPSTLLRTYVPDLTGFVQHMNEEHVEEAAWSRVVHP